MSYRIQKVLDALHVTAALSDELEALVVSYETDDTTGLTFSERKERMAKFNRAYTSLQESVTRSIASSRDLVSLLTPVSIDELYSRLESDVADGRPLLNYNQRKVISKINEVDEPFNRLESDVANAHLFLDDNQKKVFS